jgi:hypothetical protein
MKNPTFITIDTPSDGINVHRNFQCPEYNDCLADAALENLDLHCCDCPLRDTIQSIARTELEVLKCISIIDNN